MLKIEDIDGFPRRILEMAQKYSELLSAINLNGKTVFEEACPAAKLILDSLSQLHGRYGFMESRPEYTSRRTFVFRVWDNQDLDRHGRPHRVALKFMIDKKQFLRDVSVRRCNFDHEFVIPLTNCFPNSESELEKRPNVVPLGDVLEDTELTSTTFSKTQLDTFFCVAMPLAERTLHVEISQDATTRNISGIRKIFSQLVRCVQHVHSRGMIHGDVTPHNIVRTGSVWRLIDLDSAAEIGTGKISYMSSASYVPPEAVFVDRDAGLVFLKTIENKNELLEIGKAVNFDLLIAHTSFDTWSLGCVLYQLCHPQQQPLFSDGEMCVGKEDKLKWDNLIILEEWSLETKDKKLLFITDPLALNLLRQMLSKDPLKRPTLERVLDHPFLSGKPALRLVGEPADWDVFISYRPEMDTKFAQKLCTLLLDKGVRSVQIAENETRSKKAVVEAMFKSRIVVVVSSDRCLGMRSLTADHDTDLLLMEVCLALELVDAGLLEAVFPVNVLSTSVDGSSSVEEKSALRESIALPDVCVTAVDTDVCVIMEANGLCGSVVKQRTVATAIESLYSTSGAKELSEGEEEAGWIEVVSYVVDLLRSTNNNA